MKNSFENELMLGMARELQAHDKKQGMQNLVKAADYLHSAVQILEDAGLTDKADKILRVLGKIAAQSDTKVKQMPSLKSFLENGVSISDFKGLGSGDAFAKARVNTAFRRLGYTDKEIADFIGKDNLMPEDEAATLMNPDGFYNKMLDWIKNPKDTPASSDLKPGDEFSMSSLVDINHAATKKPKDPTKVSDRHNFRHDLLNADIDDMEVTLDDESDSTFEDND